MKENVVLPLQNVGTVWAFFRMKRGAELMAGKYLMLNKELKLIFPRGTNIQAEQTSSETLENYLFSWWWAPSLLLLWHRLPICVGAPLLLREVSKLLLLSLFYRDLLMEGRVNEQPIYGKACFHGTENLFLSLKNLYYSASSIRSGINAFQSL